MKFEDYLGLEQARELASNMPVLVVSSAAINILIAFILWPRFSHAELLVWLTISLIVVFSRWFSTRRFQKEGLTQNSYSNQLKIHAFWSSLNGLTWGAAAFFFQDVDAPLYSLYLVCALTGYISVTLISNTIYLPQFLGFVYCAAFPYLLSFWFLEGTLYSVLGTYAVIYSIVMSAFGRVANNNYIAAKRAAYDNIALLDSVTKEKKLATEAINQKNKFLAATSHDLRQPLHALGLYVDALKVRHLDNQSLEITEKIKSASDALNELMNGLLDISKLDASAIENRPTHFDLFSLINRLVGDHRVQLDEGDVELVNLIVRKEYVFADPVLTERIIRNLLSNAIKYTKEGRITINSEIQGGEVLVSITDTGIGVPSDQVENIFNEFTQLHNPERDRTKGLGLGLSIVKRLCALQDIQLEFRSDEGVGTEVRLFLSKGDESLTPIELDSNNAIVKGLTILFVDDEKSIRDGMKMMIESWQCTSIIASNGSEALSKIIEHNADIDLLISDLRLKNHENGVDLIHAIREELNEDIPAIILTGDTAVEKLTATKESGIELLHKPIDSNTLRSKVEEVFNMNRR